MREILFRGQTRRYGEKVRMGDGFKLPSNWVYGGVLQGCGGHSIIYGSENRDNPGKDLEKHIVYTDTLGQFTGKTDRNGKKIFEGDIVRYTNKDGTPAHYQVAMDEKMGAWMFKWLEGTDGGYPLMGFCDLVEIIGNIHDAPDEPKTYSGLIEED